MSVRFGFRVPSLRKRIAARSSWKRMVGQSLGLRAPRGWGWITNPRRAAYNRIYNRTTVRLGKGCAPFIAVGTLLLAYCCWSFVSAGIPQGDMAGNPLTCDIKGRFHSAYGFEVQIPRGLRACNGWHRAWMIPLGRKSEDRYVTFGTGPNAGGTSEKGVENWASELIDSSLHNPDRPNAKLTSRVSTRLGAEPAVRFVIRFRPAGAPEDVVEDSLTAFRTASKDDVSDSYSFDVELTTTAKSYDRDRATFEAFLRTWVFKGAPTP